MRTVSGSSFNSDVKCPTIIKYTGKKNKNERELNDTKCTVIETILWNNEKNPN